MVCNLSILFCVFFFFKQKTAYEMRISDWSSDVCSSDLDEAARERAGPIFGEARARFIAGSAAEGTPFRIDPARHDLCRRGVVDQSVNPDRRHRSEEHTSELQSLMRISYAVFCLKKKKHTRCYTNENLHLRMTTRDKK